jgi:hypothetical protein
MTELQRFDIINTIGDVEIRRYAPCAVADVIVRADFERAGNIGFGPLVSYISRSGIAMTAPVVLEPHDAESWIVSFVMPDGMALDDLPVPGDSRLALRDSPEEVCAALRFTGYTSERRVAAKERQLRESLERAGITAIGAARIARFDPPWKPGFLRHNEVVIPVHVP